MTIISGSTFSPLSRLQIELTSQVESGTIKSTDADALSGALQSIDSSLSASRTADSGSSRPDPSEVKSKIDSLIAGQVSSGALTSDQAGELTSLFQSAGPKGGHGHGGSGGAGGPPPGGGPGGPGGPDGPPPGPAPGGSDDVADASSTATTSSSSDVLASFVKQLQTSLHEGYGQSGTSKTSSSTSLLFSITA